MKKTAEKLANFSEIMRMMNCEAGILQGSATTDQKFLFNQKLLHQ